MKKKVLLVLGIMSCCLVFGQIETNAKEIVYVNSRNPYLSTSSRYDHLYANPPRQSLYAMGRYIMGTSKVRYVHSPSRLKGVKHAARINAYNYAYMN